MATGSSPERRVLQALIDESQKTVNGKARIKLYKGHARWLAATRQPTASSTSISPPSRLIRSTPGRRRRVHQAQRPAHAYRRIQRENLKKGKVKVVTAAAKPAKTTMKKK